MTISKCDQCVDVKPAANSYCRCEACGYWRPLKPKERAKAAQRAPK